MTERKAFEINEMKKKIIAERRVCEVCGKPGTQLAHRIPQTKYNLQYYGGEIIHHEKNLALVCSLECNSQVNISQYPVLVRALVRDIEKTIRKEKKEE